MRILIIGNSATAVGAIESIRQHNEKAEVVAVSEEDILIYSRPLLSHFLAGEIEESRLVYRASDFYTRHSVEAVVNSRVVSIDASSHQSAQAHSHEPPSSPCR